MIHPHHRTPYIAAGEASISHPQPPKMGGADAVVLYPAPSISHVISTLELGKLLLSHRPSLSIHILISSQVYTDAPAPAAAYIASVSASFPSISFNRLPVTSLPPNDDSSTPSKSTSHITLILHLIRLNNPHVRQALTSISAHHTVLAFVIDFFCYPAFSIARDLSVPCYHYSTSGAGILAFFLYFSTLHDKYSDETYSDPKTLLHVPGLPPLPKKYVSLPIKDRGDAVYCKFLESSKVMAKLDGVILNSFEKLEPRVTKALKDGHCVTDGPTPPIYCIGPVVSNHVNCRGEHGDDALPESLKWLDSQPKASVVFLCFGSLGVFSLEQLREIASGLERSRQRFLWVVRNPPHGSNRPVSVEAQAELDLESLFPDGFLDRTRETGLVVKSWAPQVAVLNHPSTGGFVTHSGWNSVLEAVCAGVPMISWPLYAEQGHNKVMMVEELKIALPMEVSDEGLVAAAEVERRVRELMDSESEESKSMRDRMAWLKDEAAAAMCPGGSSKAAVAALLESWAGGTRVD
ncbi:hypothetical protein SAY86_012536 [Trapa natans]|uniref:Glycosyltransferase n=1 Tax=Trapa natans TaxID=22666 RepID=A0AAN7MA66_TRANT|nr:hypothetical protein SAY86_012536 [Trapa natans]